jgi:hypothetical protein
LTDIPPLQQFTSTRHGGGLADEDRLPTIGTIFTHVIPHARLGASDSGRFDPFGATLYAVTVIAHGVGARRFQPRFLPENQASCLAPTVGSSITSCLQMDGIIYAAALEIRIAGFVRAFVDLKTLATELKHLRHERHPLELTILIERPKDLLFAQDFYPNA